MQIIIPVIIHNEKNTTGINVSFWSYVKIQYKLKWEISPHFNLPEAQPQCAFFHALVRIRLATYSCNGYEFVSYCRKLPDIQKSTGMPAYSREF